MSVSGTKVPMERTANGWRVLEDDSLLENVIQFFMLIRSNENGTTGEVPWDRKMGTPWELARHRNVKAGMVERYVSTTIARFKAYAGEHLRFTAVERFAPAASNTVWLRWWWRNVQTGKVTEEATSVEFAE